MSNAPSQSRGPKTSTPKSDNESSDRSVGEALSRHGQAAAEHFIATPAKNLLGQLQQYAHEKPDVAVCWCFALGVIVGWKLRS
ncbi:hypothetical protein [Stieleria varia]|uniref:DUF883 domain-containing protein n=1 Tax=Stieleria varia TaxID=2528005 RepID=A0A5C6AWQ0_9BACT|nr:hypothetical protein [Stieleria varia]TWU02544.1 hypothetical protein Pla52n_35940 [Stieleria varia]